MRILLLGSGGSMGKRYQAILKSSDHTVMCADKGDNWEPLYGGCDRVILATPTRLHSEQLIKLIEMGKKPILCEKPIATDVTKVEFLLEFSRRNEVPLEMMRQYEKLPQEFVFKPDADALTYYNYYNTGKDGLIWDCIQIIGAARNAVLINNDSPTWVCNINGYATNSSHMDDAYADFICAWIDSDGQGDLETILKYHEKTARFEREHGRDNNGLYWNPSEK